MDYELCLISRLVHLKLQYYNAAGSVWVEEGTAAQGLHQINLSGVAYTRTHSHIPANKHRRYRPANRSELDKCSYALEMKTKRQMKTNKAT